MMPAMTPIDSLQGALGAAGRAGVRWSTSWWHVVYVGALILVLALSPSSYRRDDRLALAHHIWLGTAPLLPWFTLLSALVSLVLIRIVVVTAASYGLAQYAIQMVARVLVLELIPLTAALFVALRATVPSGAELTRMHTRGAFASMLERGIDPLRHELMPRVVAGIFAVALLAALSCVLAMVLAYLSVYGFTLSALPGFTRTVGQVFNPAVALILVLKTLFFSLAVSLIPVAAFLRGAHIGRSSASVELDSLVRMSGLILLIEVASLVGNYY